MVIRNAVSHDSRALALVGIQAWESAVVQWGENTNDLREPAHRAYWTFCSNHWNRIVLAEEGGSVLGWGACEHADEVISDLWVDPNHHGRGIGKHLLHVLERNIAKAGFTAARLETHAKNEKAIGFYEKQGYRVSALSVTYSNSLQRDIPVVTMRREFQDPSPEQLMTE